MNFLIIVSECDYCAHLLVFLRQILHFILCFDNCMTSEFFPELFLKVVSTAFFLTDFSDPEHE